MNKRLLKSSLLLATAILLFGSVYAHAEEIPSLSWERGKVQNVVLGGDRSSLGWQLFLVNDSNFSMRFSESVANSRGFLVYSIMLPRDMDLGAYRIVARGDSSEVKTMAAVEAIERFQYNVLQVPRDFFFLLFCFLGFLVMVAFARTRLIRVQEESFESFFLQTASDSNLSVFSDLRVALLKQRSRLSESWLGGDAMPIAFRNLDLNTKAFLPVIVVMVSAFAALLGLLTPIDEPLGFIIFGILTLCSMLDRYSGKLAFISYLVIFVALNVNLNLPSALSTTLLLSSFLLPQFVGSVVLDLLQTTKALRSLKAELLRGIAGLASGGSVFWLYLMGESLLKSGGTNASLLTLAAALSGVGFMIRTSEIESRMFSPSGSMNPTVVSKPVISVNMAILISVLSFLTLYVWTGSETQGVIFSLVVLVTLVCTLVFVGKSVNFWMNFFTSIRAHFALLVLLEVSIVLGFNFSPLMIETKSTFMALLAPIPVCLFSLFVMLGANRLHPPTPSRPALRVRGTKDKSRSDYSSFKSEY